MQCAIYHYASKWPTVLDSKYSVLVKPSSCADCLTFKGHLWNKEISPVIWSWQGFFSCYFCPLSDQKPPEREGSSAAGEAQTSDEEDTVEVTTAAERKPWVCLGSDVEIIEGHVITERPTVSDHTWEYLFAVCIQATTLKEMAEPKQWECALALWQSQTK